MVNMKAWFIKQRWHFIYGLIILCLLAGTIWQRVSMQKQAVLVKQQAGVIKMLGEHIALDHMLIVHGRKQQLERF